MNCFVGRVAFLLVWGVIGFGPAAAVADASDALKKTELQSSLLRFLDSGSNDSGAFRIIDRNTGIVVNAHPGALHPRIIPFGTDYVLCIEMYDDSGGRHDADFVLRKDGDSWVVVDVLFNQRALLKTALSEID